MNMHVRTAATSSAPTMTPLGNALCIIDASIQPIEEWQEPDLRSALDELVMKNDVRSAIELYDGYVSVAEVLASFTEKRISGRDAAHEHLEQEIARAWAKAYLVADRLKLMRPSENELTYAAEVLFKCSLMMGNDLSETIAAIEEFTANAVIPSING